MAKFTLPKNAPLDLVVEDDDFLEHPEIFEDHELIADLEEELLYPLFPDGGDEALAEEWKEVLAGDAALRGIAPLTADAFAPDRPLKAAGHYNGNGRDLGIADRLRAYGLKVVEVEGWRTRGSATFHPRGSVDHHTAGGLKGNAPSLRICTHGRSDLPGPLCHVLIGRDNTCYVIASGRANHAGSGSYSGITGNSNVYGVEHENTGIGNEPWREDQRVTAAKCHAALLDWRRGNSFVCQHKEWTPRKIDKWGQTGPDMRNRVAAAWKSRDNKEPQEMPLFKDHPARSNFVKDSYRNIVGREVESQETHDQWCWFMAFDESVAFQMTGLLHKEAREKAAREITAAKSEASAAKKDAAASVKALSAANTKIAAAEAAISGLAESVATGGGGTGPTVEAVLSEISSRLQVKS